MIRIQQLRQRKEEGEDTIKRALNVTLSMRLTSGFGIRCLSCSESTSLVHFPVPVHNHASVSEILSFPLYCGVSECP